MYRNYGTFIKEYEKYDAQYGLGEFFFPDTYQDKNGTRHPMYSTGGVPQDIEGLKVTGYSRHELKHFSNKRARK